MKEESGYKKVPSKKLFLPYLGEGASLFFRRQSKNEISGVSPPFLLLKKRAERMAVL